MDCLPAHGLEPEPFAGVVFAPRASLPPPSRLQRGVVAAFVLALHALFAWFVQYESQRRDDSTGAPDEPVAVAFIETLPRQVIRAEPTQDQAPMRIVPARPRVAAAPSTPGRQRTGTD